MVFQEKTQIQRQDKVIFEWGSRSQIRVNWSVLADWIEPKGQKMVHWWKGGYR